MTNEEKAAIMLISLDEELAANVMRNLNPSEIRRIGTSMNRLASVSDEKINLVAKEFYALAQGSGKRIVSIKDNFTAKLITKALGAEKARDVLGVMEKDNFCPSTNPIVDKLRDVDPRTLLEFTKMEHPQTMALILAHLRPEQAAELLENLPPDRQGEIVNRIATLKSVPHGFIDEMAKALEAELVLGSANEDQFGGIGMMAEILNKMSASSENEILSSLEKTNPDLVLEIRSLMFTFDDIFNLDGKSMREVVQAVGGEDWARALKIVDKDMREIVFQAMSKRGAEMLREDLELMPPIRLSEVEESQKKIIDVVKKLEVEGKVVISRGGDQEDALV
ncbi:MAG: flagellar motor switch protein FliG [Syntrophales bacterium]|nr:flagellar motor switch protein FliG [Syntrophales bacterium]